MQQSIDFPRSNQGAKGTAINRGNGEGRRKKKEMDGLRHPEGKNGDVTAIALAERADSASKEKENGI